MEITDLQVLVDSLLAFQSHLHNVHLYVQGSAKGPIFCWIRDALLSIESKECSCVFIMCSWQSMHVADYHQPTVEV